MVDNIAQRVYEIVRPYAGAYVFSNKHVQLTPETDLDSDLSIDELEAEDLMELYFKVLNVDKGNFDLKKCFPDAPILWNPFKKTQPIPVPDFTIGMLIESAKSGKWLYD